MNCLLGYMSEVLTFVVEPTIIGSGDTALEIIGIIADTLHSRDPGEC